MPTSARTRWLRRGHRVRLAVAEDERQRRGKALADIVHNAVVVKGIHLAAPFGYAKLGRGEGLVPDPQEAPVVALMFAKRAEGYSWGKIAEAANATGIHPRPRKRNGVVAQATWTAQSCSQLTQSEVYLGKAYNGDHETPGAHEAIISRELWERVEERRGAQPKRGTDGHLLSGGLVRCSGCGRALIAVPTAGRLYYRCRHKACPVRVSVAAGALEEWVVAEFKRVAFGQEWRAETDDAPVRAAEAQHAAALEDYAQVLANRPRHEAARAVWQGQLDAADRQVGVTADAVAQAIAVARKVLLPPELDEAVFDSSPLDARRHWLGLLLATVVVTPGVGWRPPIADRVVPFGIGEIPARNATEVMAWVAARDW